MNNDRNKKIEEILGSLDNVQKAAVPDFFYTRLKARMEKDLVPVTKKSLLLRPAFALSALAAVLIINAFVIFKGDTGKSNISNNDAETIQSLAAEYRLNDNINLYDINQDK